MRYFKEFFRFLKHLSKSRELLFTLIKSDFKKQYLGSFFGLAWVFIQPIIFILVIWFVFEIGFRKSLTANDTPFFLWLVSGMIPWFFLANGFTTGTNSIVKNSFLVKKVAFRVSILPLVDIGSAVIIHLVLIGFLISAFLLYGYLPSLYWLQLPFYILSSILILLGVSWLTSSLRVFIKDVGNLITLLVQIGFWATPIFWSINMVPLEYQWLVKLNPAFYIVEGYRNTFINQRWFWEDVELMGYFFGVTMLFFVGGAIVFKRLRPHFGDVM